LTSTRSRLVSNWRATAGRAFLAKLSKERQSPVTFEGRAASSVLVQHDAQRRGERGRQLVLRHPASGKRITDVVLHRFAGLASDLQQSAMISSVDIQSSGTPSSFFLALAFKLLQTAPIFRRRAAEPSFLASPAPSERDVVDSILISSI
jgi:hypothetical protein